MVLFIKKIRPTVQHTVYISLVLFLLGNMSITLNRSCFLPQVMHDSTAYERKKRTKELRNLVKENNVKREQRFYIKLPSPVEHKNHLSGEVCAMLIHPFYITTDEA